MIQKHCKDFWNGPFLLKICTKIQWFFSLTECICLYPNTKPVTLTTEKLASFQVMKDSLSNLTGLDFQDLNIQNNQLVTDSSNYVVGAALHQIIDNEPVHISFFF